MVRAKGDQIVSTSASSNAGRIIISIRVSLGTSRLEDLRIRSRLACLWVPKASSAAVPGRVESKASALAGHHPPVIVGSDLKTHRAHHVEVADAPGVAAFAGAFEGRDCDGEVVAVYQADIVEVLVVSEGDLGESSRRCAADAVAEEVTAAVAGGAATASGGVEGTAMATPESAGPEWWEAERVGLVWWELEASAG